MKLLSVLVLFLLVNCTSEKTTQSNVVINNNQAIQESINRTNAVSTATQDLFDEVSVKAKAGL